MAIIIYLVTVLMERTTRLRQVSGRRREIDPVCRIPVTHHDDFNPLLGADMATLNGVIDASSRKQVD